MKKYIYTGVLLLGMLGVNAQNKDTKKADKHYDNLEYVRAISEYLEVVEDGNADAYVHGRLADAYYKTSNTAESAAWYARALAVAPNAGQYFNYAQALKANGNYDAANDAMNSFANLAPNDARAIAHKNNPNAISDLLNEDPNFTVKALEGFNTPYSEFGPLLHKSQLYYASARSEKSKKYGWNKEPFLDVYVSNYDAVSGEMSNELALTGGVNTSKNEGTVSFSPDGNTMYFSGESVLRNAGIFKKKFIKDDSGKSTINIYSATLEGGEWKNITSLPFNGDNHNSGGPAVNVDGSRLYFSSDMEGSLGDSDIWYVAINGDGTYGLPVNLGPSINTDGKEAFPFVSSDNMLYFSSNGHPGLGMLDVFGAAIKGDDFGALRNVGAPINSGNDDFSFSIDEATKIGFFASNRPGGAGSDDIYSFEQIAPICEVELTVKVVDSRTNEALVNASVLVFGDDNVQVASKMTNANGEIIFMYECDQAFRVEASMETYTGNAVAVEKTSERTIAKTVVLEAPIELKPIFFDLDKYDITEAAIVELDKVVTLLQDNPQMIIRVESHTDSRASDKYNMELSTNRVKASVDYILSKGIHAHRVYGKGFGETQLVNDCANDVDCSEEEHQANRRSEFFIVED